MSTTITLPYERITNKILLIRGKKVMLDSDLAQLYNVPIKRLNEQVRRNIDRFPKDFMFQLTKNEAISLRSQFATLKRGKNIKYLPYAFTEQGVAMLSSVLNSPKAIQVNIQIIRTFTKLREILIENQELAKKLEQIELKYDKQITEIFELLDRLMIEEEKIEEPKERIGFSTP